MNIILILLLLHVIFYKPSGVLSCGLFGYSGSKAPDINALRILGLYNVQRGSDSCGIYLDGNVEKGTGQIANFRIFCERTELLTPEKDFTVIGHTRKASSGYINSDSAHPYSYFRNHELSDVFVHNGTVRNWEHLVKKHTNDSPNDYLTDSQAVGLMLVNGKTEILKEYYGAITCIKHSLDKPGCMWIWKGASTEDDKRDGDRPLYGLKVDGGMYVSSIEESLDCINGGMNEIINFPTNTIIEIEHGEIVSELPVKRKLEKKQKTVVKHIPKVTADRSLNKDKIEDKNQYKGRVYWEKGRYWRNGHLLKTFLYLDDDGKEVPNGQKYYFYRGIMVDCKNSRDYKETCKKLDKLFKQVDEGKGVFDNRKEIALLSKEPFDYIAEEYKSTIGHFRTYTTFINGKFEPKFARKIVAEFKGGDLADVTEKKIDYDSMSEEEWKKMIDQKEVENRLKNLDKEPDSYWENLEWDKIDIESLHPDIRDYYWEKCKEFKPEESEVDDISDTYLHDYVTNEVVGGLELALQHMEEEYSNTSFRDDLFLAIVTSADYIKGVLEPEEIAWDEN